MLTSKCAWRIFAPQRRALFRHPHLQKCSERSRQKRRALFEHLNFQKCSEHEVLLAFWLQNELRDTRACNFRSLIPPHGSAPATLVSLLFYPPEPQDSGKHSLSRLFYLYAGLALPFRAPGSSFFWLFLWELSLLWFFSSSFFFSGSSHLWCFTFPYCRKFDFKFSSDHDSMTECELGRRHESSAWDTPTSTIMVRMHLQARPKEAARLVLSAKRHAFEENLIRKTKVRIRNYATKVSKRISKVHFLKQLPRAILPYIVPHLARVVLRVWAMANEDYHEMEMSRSSAMFCQLLPHSQSLVISCYDWLAVR